MSPAAPPAMTSPVLPDRSIIIPSITTSSYYTEIMRNRSRFVNPAEALQGEPDERMSLLFDVWLVSRATTDLIDRALASSGLDADEFAVYSLLAGGDAVTPSELSRWMAAPP